MNIPAHLLDFVPLIRKIVHEETSPSSKPAPSEPSSETVQLQRPAILARVHELREQIVSIDARKAEVLDDERRIAELRRAILEADADETRAISDTERAKVRLRKWEAEIELDHLESGGEPKAFSGFIALRPQLSARFREIF